MSLLILSQVGVLTHIRRDYRVNLTGNFPVDIRVTRVTADSTSSSLIDAFTWTSLGEIIDDANTYPIVHMLESRLTQCSLVLFHQENIG